MAQLYNDHLDSKQDSFLLNDRYCTDGAFRELEQSIQGRRQLQEERLFSSPFSMKTWKVLRAISRYEIEVWDNP